jgi:hypothetical protein
VWRGAEIQHETGWMTNSVYLLRYTHSKMDTMRPKAIQAAWKEKLAGEAPYG